MTTLGMSVRSILAASAALWDALAHGDGALPQVELVLALKHFEHMVDDAVVEVRAAEEGVAAGGDDLEHRPMQLQHRHVEGAAPEVVHQHLLRQVAPDAIGQCRRGGLVDDAAHRQAGQLAGLLHRVALVVVVIRRHRDDGLFDHPPEELLGDGASTLASTSAEICGSSVGLVAEEDGRFAPGALHDVVGEPRAQLLDHPAVELAPNQPLGAVNGVPRVDQHLVLGQRADEDLPALGERHGQRGGLDFPRSLGDHLRNAVAHMGDAGVRGAQIDADDPGLFRPPSLGPYHARTMSDRFQPPPAAPDATPDGAAPDALGATIRRSAAGPPPPALPRLPETTGVVGVRGQTATELEPEGGRVRPTEGGKTVSGNPVSVSPSPWVYVVGVGVMYVLAGGGVMTVQLPLGLLWSQAFTFIWPSPIMLRLFGHSPARYLGAADLAGPRARRGWWWAWPPRPSCAPAP